MPRMDGLTFLRRLMAEDPIPVVVCSGLTARGTQTAVRALEEGALARVEMLDQISMAFLAVLQRLTPTERAVLLLRDVFDFGYLEIAALVDKSEVACRKLLERARENVANEKRFFSASPEAHRGCSPHLRKLPPLETSMLL